jgi:type II secretory pathway pseudopilin PulG
MKSEAGFTLIETLVTGVIALIIPVVVIAVLKVSTSQLSWNSAGLRLTQIADGVSEEIRRAALKATYVYEWSIAEGGCPDPVAVPATGMQNITGVVLCNKDRAVIAGYKVTRLSGAESDRGVLEELKAGVWKPVAFSSDVVKVTWNSDPFIQKKPGLFGIQDGGYFFWFNFRFDMSVSGVQLKLPLQTESAVCRNAPSMITGW